MKEELAIEEPERIEKAGFANGVGREEGAGRTKPNRRAQQAGRMRVPPLFICALVAAAALTFFAICVSIFMGQRETKYLSSKIATFPRDYEMLDMTEDMQVDQAFVPQYNGLDSVLIFLTNLVSDETGTLTYSILDSDGETVLEREVPLADIKVGDYYPLSVHKRLRAGESYLLRLRVSGVSNSEGLMPKLLLVSGETDVTENRDLAIQYQESGDGLIIGYKYKLVRLHGYTEDETALLQRHRILCLGIAVFLLAVLTAFGILTGKRRWKLVLAEGILLILFCQVAFSFDIMDQLNSEKRTMDYGIRTDVDFAQQLDEGVPLVQTFTSDQPIYGIRLYLRAVGKESQPIRVSVSDAATGEILDEATARPAGSQKAEYADVPIRLPNPDGENLSYEMTVLAGSGYDPGRLHIFGSSDNRYPNGSLSVGGEETQGDLAFQLLVNGSAIRIAVLVNWLFAALMAVFFIGTFVLFYRRCRIETAFVVLASLVGAFYLFIFPPNTVADSFAHTATAYHTSNMLMGIPDESIRGHVMTMRAEDVPEGSIYFRSADVEAWMKVLYFLENSPKDDSELTEAKGITITQWPLPYLPSALGITLARLLDLGSLPLIWVGEAFNLVTYIALIYWAIRRMPFCKKAMFALALCPMAMNLAASFSYHTILMGTSFCFIAFVLDLAYVKKGKVTGKSMAMMAFWLLLLALQKSGSHLVLALLLFLIPRHRWPFAAGKNLSERKKRKRRAVIALSCGGVLLALGILIYMNFDSIKAISNPYHLMMGRELAQTPTPASLIGSPFHTMGIFFKTFLEDAGYFVEAAFGRWLSWVLQTSPLSDLEINQLFIWGFILCFIVASLSENNGAKRTSGRDRLIMGGVGILQILLLGVIALIGSTPASRVKIIFEGRFFLPVLPLLACVLSGIRSIKIKNTGNLLPQLTSFLQLLTVADVLRVTLSR